LKREFNVSFLSLPPFSLSLFSLSLSLFSVQLFLSLLALSGRKRGKEGGKEEEIKGKGEDR
jgi:hypothetical protein